MNNKNIILLGGTGFVGQVIKKALENKNNIMTVGSSGNTKYNITEGLNSKIKQLIINSDLVIYCSWDFKASKKNYFLIHVNAVKEVVEFCNKHKKSLLFISTLLANENSKSIYNKTKYICEQIVLKKNQSILKLSVVVSNLNKNGNIYLKISKLPTIFGYKILLKPNNAKFRTTDIYELKIFFDNYSFQNSNIFVPNTKLLTLSNIIDLFTLKNNKYIFVNWKPLYFIVLFLEFFGVKSRIRPDSILSIWGE